MNLLDLVPAFKRNLNQYINDVDTDSTLAAYLADAVKALNWRWTRSYTITQTPPNSYSVSPDVVAKDERPIIVMASIIYKGANTDSTRFTDGDFRWDPQPGNPIISDMSELDRILGKSTPLASAQSAPMRGFQNFQNPESYAWLCAIGAI